MCGAQLREVEHARMCQTRKARRHSARHRCWCRTALHHGRATYAAPKAQTIIIGGPFLFRAASPTEYTHQARCGLMKVLQPQQPAPQPAHATVHMETAKTSVLWVRQGDARMVCVGWGAVKSPQTRADGHLCALDGKCRCCASRRTMTPGVSKF